MMGDDLMNEDEGGWALSAEQAAVVDALVAAGFEIDRVEGLDAAQMEIARRVVNDLRLLEAGAVVQDEATAKAERERRAAAVLAIVERRRVGTAEHVELSGADEDALEALVAAGFAPERVASGMRRRATAHAALLGLLAVRGAEPSAAEREAMVARTLAFVERGALEQRTRMTLEPAAVERRRWRLRTADVVTAAALALVVGAAVGPMVSHSRAMSRQTATLANLGSIGAALSQYSAGSSGGGMGAGVPLAYEPSPSQVWWNVGTPRQSNTEHFYLLVKQGFATLEQMAAPTNAHAVVQGEAEWTDWPTFESVSYSFRNVVGPAMTRCPKSPDELTIVAADRSPVVIRARRGETMINVMENSFAHGGRGQAVLRFGGSVAFMTTPMTERGDNIWIPRCVETALRAEAEARGSGRGSGTKCGPLHGTEAPGCATDDFVCP